LVVRHDAPEIRVDDERRLAARTGQFELGLQACHGLAPLGAGPRCPDYDSAVSSASPAIRIATYNIHRSRGLDGRTRPDRIAGVVRAIDADIIALQEVVGAGPHGGGHAEALGAALGMGWVMAPARQLRGHQFGNAVLSRFPITHHVEHDLSWKTCEP